MVSLRSFWEYLFLSESQTHGLTTERQTQLSSRVIGRVNFHVRVSSVFVNEHHGVNQSSYLVDVSAAVSRRWRAV